MRMKIFSTKGSKGMRRILSGTIRARGYLSATRLARTVLSRDFERVCGLRLMCLGRLRNEEDNYQEYDQMMWVGEI